MRYNFMFYLVSIVLLSHIQLVVNFNIRLINRNIYSKTFLFENQNNEQLSSFSRSSVDNNNKSRKTIDYSTLNPSDPLFLDLDWSTIRKSSPESKAYADHLAWKRSLTDVERLRWQKWAIYQRVTKGSRFEYCLEDYIMQSMLSKLRKKANSMKNMNNKEDVSALVWKAIADSFQADEIEEVQAVIKSFYSAINRQNYDDILTLWQPQTTSHVILPGNVMNRGFWDIDRSFKRMMKISKPLGKIEYDIISCQVQGFYATVNVMENIHVNPNTVINKKKANSNAMPSNIMNKNTPKTGSAVKRLFASTTLRKFNKQWRIVHYHAARFNTSTLTNDANYQFKSNENKFSTSNNVFERNRTGKKSNINNDNNYDDKNKDDGTSSLSSDEVTIRNE